ncbi:MAG TPA: hypothetical protein VKA81_02105, partial [Verrucomicrobiae bacterium]|nr:hypothetical protein [Verrucomicrobiae bacterium]
MPPPHVGRYNAVNFFVRSPPALSCIACAGCFTTSPAEYAGQIVRPIPTRHSLLNRLKDWGARHRISRLLKREVTKL